MVPELSLRTIYEPPGTITFLFVSLLMVLSNVKGWCHELDQSISRAFARNSVAFKFFLKHPYPLIVENDFERLKNSSSVQNERSGRRF